MLADFGKLEKNLKQASEHYFHPQELFVTSYNKAKHGAPIIHDSKLGPGGFLLIAPQRDPAAGRYEFLKFGTGDEIVTHTMKLVRWVSQSTQALVSFARNLKTVGLLYSPFNGHEWAQATKPPRPRSQRRQQKAPSSGAWT